MRWRFKPEYFTRYYTDRFDLNKMEFKCVSGDKTISIEDMNDDNCDCCDGSDEFLNNSLYCPNTCNVSLNEKETNALNILYNKAILNRIELEEERKVQYEALKDENGKLIKQRDDLRTELINSTERLKNQEEMFRRWVYESNGLKVLDERELEEKKKEYVEKIEKGIYKSVIEEEEEGFSSEKIDETALRVKRENRALKFDSMIKEEFNDLREKAFRNYFKDEESDNSFLSKLKGQGNKYPPIYQEILDIKAKIAEMEPQYYQINNEVYANEDLLKMGAGEDYQWFQPSDVVIQGPLRFSTNTIVFDLFRRVYVKPLMRRGSRSEDYGAFIERKGKLMIYKVDHDERPSQRRTIKVRLVCYHAHNILDAVESAKLHIDAIVGLPEICPSQFSSDEFNEWLSEVQPYKDDILSNGIFSEL